MLTAQSLRERDHAKKALKKETYKKILDGFFKKIKASADAGNKYVILQIPNFILGCPMFKSFHATKYLIRQLQLCGYKVCIIQQQVIGVTWICPKPKKTRIPDEPYSDMEELPSLINLKKVAKHYTRK